jgi:hypothetical protein
MGILSKSIKLSKKISENTKSQLIIRSIKMVAIFYSAFVYILFAFFFVIFLDKHVFPNVDKEKESKKTVIRLILELCAIVGFTGIVSYLFRNFAHAFLFPFDGIYGYSHSKVSEIKSGSLFTAYVILFNNYLQNKLKLIKNKIVNNLNKSMIGILLS